MGVWDSFEAQIGLAYTLDRLGMCRAYVDDGGSGHAEPYLKIGYLNLETNLERGIDFFSEVKYLRKRRKVDGYKG